MKVKLEWGLSAIGTMLSAVAGGDSGLHEYEGNSLPGQHWSAYRPKPSLLPDVLDGLLSPTTREDALKAMDRPNDYCPYLRTKQKAMSHEHWLWQGARHNGAHFPLAVFTKNASSRSAAREKERNESRRAKKGKGKAKGKGFWQGERQGKGKAKGRGERQ